jgi:hypothetical protein
MRLKWEWKEDERSDETNTRTRKSGAATFVCSLSASRSRRCTLAPTSRNSCQSLYSDLARSTVCHGTSGRSSPVHQSSGKPSPLGWRDEDAPALCGLPVQFGGVGANRSVAFLSSASFAMGETSIAPAVPDLATGACSSSRRTPCNATI